MLVIKGFISQSRSSSGFGSLLASLSESGSFDEGFSAVSRELGREGSLGNSSLPFERMLFSD